jgi:hypothetical protein
MEGDECQTSSGRCLQGTGVAESLAERAAERMYERYQEEANTVCPQ